MLTFHAIGDWPPGRVRLEWGERSSRRLVPEVERVIDDTWARVLSRPGVHLFDGPMCRMESFAASTDALTLALSPTSYKPFVGTNLENPHLADVFGPGVMANPVGVSTLLETADGFLMLGRRNAAVAYYPSRVHPFAGALEPRDGADPFAAVYRELSEELSLDPQDLTGLRCAGLVEDHALRQPELIFTAVTSLARAGVEARLDREEHHATWSAGVRQVEDVLGDASLTPVAVAALLLWRRSRGGATWVEL
jgi:8-oxo-dGTP pyrophosphatase MutT (NUDIX family)